MHRRLLRADLTDRINAQPSILQTVFLKFFELDVLRKFFAERKFE